MAPMVINEVKKLHLIELGFALSLSYVTGTILFNYEVSQREILLLCHNYYSILFFYSLPKNQRRTKFK